MPKHFGKTLEKSILFMNFFFLLSIRFVKIATCESPTVIKIHRTRASVTFDRIERRHASGRLVAFSFLAMTTAVSQLAIVVVFVCFGQFSKIRQKMQRLTETQVEKLIELVKQNPSLYDKHQRQNESLDLIWERIAVDLNADGK